MTDQSVSDPGEQAAGDIAPPAEAGSPVDAIRQLISDAQAAAASETALIRLSGQIAMAAIKAMSVWGIVALLTGFVGLLTLAIAAVMALAQTVGPWLAMLIVPAVLFTVALFAGWRVRARSRDMRSALSALLP